MSIVFCSSEETSSTLTRRKLNSAAEIKHVNDPKCLTKDTDSVSVVHIYEEIGGY